MTPQKVSDILIRRIDEDWHVYTDDAINALKYAAKVVEKEIPKVPIADHEKELCICPSCYTEFTTFDLANEDYCPHCGQKIDWNWEKINEGV